MRRDQEINVAGPSTINFGVDAMALWEAVLEAVNQTTLTRVFERDGSSHRISANVTTLMSDWVDNDSRQVQESLCHLIPNARRLHRAYAFFYTDQSWDVGFCPWFIEHAIDWTDITIKTKYIDLIVEQYNREQSDG